MSTVQIEPATQEILEAIDRTKRELEFHKLNSTKEFQLECFRRLINLYECFNVSELLNKRVA